MIDSVITDQSILAPQLMLEMVARACPNKWLTGMRNKALAREAWEQAHYCLDAPSTIPAGAMIAETFPPEYDLGALPVQLTIEREITL